MSAIADGSIKGVACRVEWRESVLYGDERAIRYVRAAVSFGVDTCIPGVVAGPASLEDEWHAAATFLAVFDEGLRLNVDAEPYELEDGARA